jgi:uncharacterized DUF497 family protein
MQGLRFTWDDEKALTNLREHGVPFNEAETVFDGPLALDAVDDRFEEPGFRSMAGPRRAAFWRSDTLSVAGQFALLQRAN